jgi:hypothetical protein
MLHFARIFFVAFASATASCSSELAQKGAERKEMGQQLTEAYYSCGMSRLFVEHCEAVAAKIDITRRWLGEQ